MQSLVRALGAMIVVALVSSCGGAGGSSPSQPTPPPPPPPPPVAIKIAVSGSAVVKAQSNTVGIAALEQRLTALTEPGPDRSLAIFDAHGTATGRYTAPEGFALIDFAQHPSGEISVALATATSVKFARIDRSGALLDDLTLVDPQAVTDPFIDSGGVHDDNSLLPIYTRDAVRVAAIGEDVAVGLRTGRNATVVYRFNHARPGGFTKSWRTLAEPGFSVFAIGITSGTFDTFGALENHWQLRLDADAAGNVAVGGVSRVASAGLFDAHSRYFGGTIAAVNGVLVTRIAPDGTRLGSTAIDTVQIAELHGLRMNGNDVAVVGRVFTVQRGDGGGWDAYTGHVARDSGALSVYRVLDVDLGEILFDIAPLPQGRFLVAGAAGYTQNPTGGSVSEQATPLLAVLEADGTLRTRIAFTSGPRQNQLRSLAALGDSWLVGGMVNGPGTHSGDGNRGLITADGFVQETSVNAP
jgi:hypothetical protein